MHYKMKILKILKWKISSWAYENSEHGKLKLYYFPPINDFIVHFKLLMKRSMEFDILSSSN